MSKAATTLQDDVKNHLAMMEADNDGLGDDDEPIAAESPIITEDELDDALEQNDFHETLNKARGEFEAEQAKPVNPDDHFESPPVQEVKDIYQMESSEFIGMYKNLSMDDKLHLREEYKRVLSIRDQMTAKMSELKAWCEERNIDFGTYKSVYKRANDPGRKQKMKDATYAFFCKEFGDNQRDLWES